MILIDPLNFDCYCLRQPFQYTGGLCTHTPARLQIPQDGHWYLVIDSGEYSHHVWTENIEILTPGEWPTVGDADTTLVGANAQWSTTRESGTAKRPKMLSSNSTGLSAI